MEYLKKVEKKGAKLGLNNTIKIIDHFPFSLKSIKFIQVAGTNGKGSTAHFLTSILQAAGERVGLFTSPHLNDVRERITINKEWISESDFAACVTEVKIISGNLLRKRIITNMPTFFEYTFLTSIYYFSREKVTFAILEVGLGGRFDATSTIMPDITVITGISHDHTGILGKRIKDIALEKAGIIKKGIPVVCGCKVHSIANSTIKKKARHLNAPFYNVINSQNILEVEEQDNGYHCRYFTELGNYVFDVCLNGWHQTRNATTAVKVVQLLTTMGFNIPKKTINEGIKANRVPARIEVLETTPPMILDGSHNLESALALKDFLEQKRKNRLTLIFGVLEDKNYRQMVKLLLPYIKNVILTEPISKRALPAEKLIPLFKKQGEKNIHIKKNLCDALDTAKQWRREILITGSFYLVGKMRSIVMHGG